MSAAIVRCNLGACRLTSLNKEPANPGLLRGQRERQEAHGDAREARRKIEERLEERALLPARLPPVEVVADPGESLGEVGIEVARLERQQERD